MVDSRLKSEWLGVPRFEDLSDVAWRIFTYSLMWCNGQGTDGAIPERFVNRLLLSGPSPQAAAELEATGLWERTADGYQLIGWETELGQSTAAYVRDRRDKARERMRALRGSKSSQVEDGDGERSRERAQHETPNVGPRPQAKDSLTEELNEFSEPMLYCERHPNGTDLPCVGCMNARKAHEKWQTSPSARHDWKQPGVRTERAPAPVTKAYRPGDGHECADTLGHGLCDKCGEYMSRVADHSAESALETARKLAGHA